MSRRRGTFPPIVPADDGRGGDCSPARGARSRELSVVANRKNGQRHTSGLDNDPDDSTCETCSSISSGSINNNGSSSCSSSNGSSRQHGTTRSHLPPSVYAWACGEKAEGQEEELKSSDVVIGWLVLLMQALAYGIIIQKARSVSGDGGGEYTNSSSDDKKAYSFVSVGVAMYQLVATATPDLRSGFALLVDGSFARYRIFGAALLCVFGLMITAAMTLLSLDARDDVSIVTNSVAVLFVADVDEKALTLFLTVPRQWRLFWALNMISISYSLSLIFAAYVGDSSALIGPGSMIYAFDKVLPSWFVFAVNPAAVTYFAFVISKGLQAVLDARDSYDTGVAGAREEEEARRRPNPLLLLLWRGLKSAGRAVRNEFVLYILLLGWLLIGVTGWFAGMASSNEPVAWVVLPTTSSLQLTSNLLELQVANAALAVGLAMFAARWVLERKKQRADASRQPREELGPQMLSGLESGSPHRGLGRQIQDPERLESQDKDPSRECGGIDQRKTLANGNGDADEDTGKDNHEQAHGQTDPIDAARLRAVRWDILPIEGSLLSLGVLEFLPFLWGGGWAFGRPLLFICLRRPGRTARGKQRRST